MDDCRSQLIEHRVPIPQNTQQGIVLSWSNLEYEIPLNKKQTRKIISNVSGHVQSGEMVAIMGGSGTFERTLKCKGLESQHCSIFWRVEWVAKETFEETF
jgi:ABC-type transport system involved in cytochrome bd biosynthesis fused ATPase/permease subunit